MSYEELMKRLDEIQEACDREDWYWVCHLLDGVVEELKKNGTLN